MKKGTTPGSTQKDAEVAALLAAATIVAGFVFYWTLQIQAVREMLALAYG